jgi:hypothetical protein
MGVKSMRSLSIIIGFIAGLLLTGATRLAAQDNSHPFDDGMTRVITIPTHIYTIMNTAPSACAENTSTGSFRGGGC